MKLELVDIDKLVKVNNLQEVSNPVVFDKGYVPTSDGILSTEIFGINIRDRAETFAYVKLNGHFLQPNVYKMLKRMNRNFEHVISGSKKYTITKQGELEPVEEGGESGIDWLYKNWDKIKFPRNSSNMRNERIDLLVSLPKNVIFTDKWLLMPAFYRDVDLQSVAGKQQAPKLAEINDLYTRLIRYSKMLDSSNTFDFFLNNTKYKLQELLVEIYNTPKGKIEKKNGLLRKSLLGKSVDYGVRSVITAPRFNYSSPEDVNIGMFQTGIPLVQCCALFTPFILSWVKNYLERELEQMGATYPIKKKDGTIVRVKLKSPEMHFTNEYIKKQLDAFIRSPMDRFTPIELPVEDGQFEGKIYMKIGGRFRDSEDATSESNIINRPATWCDIFYQAAIDVTSDKMVVVTRYPLLDYFGIFTSRITVLSTIRTQAVYIGNKLYTHYPVIDLNMPSENVATFFADTVNLSNLYLKGLGGDYDGDQVSVKGLYSQEAIKRAEELMYAKTNFLDIQGNNMRTTYSEGVQTLYMLTKFD